MFFFRKKNPRKKEFYEDSDRIFLYQGAYYSTAENLDSSNSFTVIPGDDIPYEEFRKLAFDYTEKILSGSLVVLNNLYCYPLEPVEGSLSEDDCVKQYVVQGGTPIFVAKNELYTVSCGIDKQLVECVLKEVWGYYGFYFYRHKLVAGASFKCDLTIHYHENHQYLEVSAPDGVSKYIDIVLEVCKQQGKPVVFPKE